MSEPFTRAAARSSRTRHSAAGPRHGRLPARRAFRSVVALIALVVSVVAASTVGLAAYAFVDVIGHLKPSVDLVDNNGNDTTPGLAAMDGAFNILLAGSDSGDGNPAYGERGETLNDVTMLLHVSSDHTHATVVSFPRDMFVSLPACPNLTGGQFSAMSRQKINTTLTYGGLPCTVLTVEKLTGLDIPYAALIEFDGVIEMSNALGGVSVCVAGDIHDPYTGLNLKAGENMLEGATALAFLRTRHGVGDGSDLGRISNQQVFLSALVRKMKSAGTLTNPVKVYSLAKAATSNMTLSTSLNSVSTLASMALAMKNIDVANVVFVQYPNHYVDGGVAPTVDAASTLMNALKADKSVVVAGNTGVGSEVSASASPMATPTSPSVASAASVPPSSAATNSVTLPDSVHGQTADQVTCSKPFTD